MKIGPCSKYESIIRMTLLLLLSLLKTKGFISLQALGELSENEDGRGVGRGKGGEEGRGVWHQNRTWFSEGRKGLVHDA